jgi:alpha-D-xyloside xylohydrolase
MKETSEKGAPVMRPLFYDFPQDRKAWEVEDVYMFGPDLLVAPVFEKGAEERSIYLPEGSVWQDAYTKEIYQGGQVVTVPAPLGIIPVMMRDGKQFDIYVEGEV